MNLHEPSTEKKGLQQQSGSDPQLFVDNHKDTQKHGKHGSIMIHWRQLILAHFRKHHSYSNNMDKFP